MKYLYPKVIDTKVNIDNRGYLIETYKKKEINTDFKYSILVSSKKNVFRGLHFQNKKQQEKLLIVLKGSIIDYCIDLRKKSKTFSKIYKFYLKKNSILYIPKGFAHGYLCLKNDNKLVYLLSNYWFKKHEKVLDFNDKEINLKIKNKKMILSKRDQNGMSLKNFRKEIKSL
jgi:dTDP-4-dehydrorhamnose 3,5-epimerase